jgi:hypothetical protein
MDFHDIFKQCGVQKRCVLLKHTHSTVAVPLLYGLPEQRTTRTTRTHRRGEGQGQRIKNTAMGGTKKRGGDESNGWGAKEEHEVVLVVFFFLPCLIHARYTQG